jgi:hypothetical protein
VPPGLGDGVGDPIDPDDPPTPDRQRQRQTTGAGPDVQRGEFRQRLGLEEREHRARPPRTASVGRTFRKVGP